MDFFDFDCAGEVIRVERSLADMSRPRVHLGAFASSSSRPPALVIERHAALPAHARVAEGPLGRCRFLLEGARMQVEVPDGMFQGELVLRLAWYLVTTTTLGGVLIHAAGISDGANALVASGKSGDGKSTLSRLCRASGLELLTDEIVQLFPDGTCGGTPFRSDEDNVGRPGRLPVRCFVALEKAASESLGALAPLAAAQLATSQCFDGDVFALPRVEVNRRVLGFLSHVQLGTLAFRKDVAVGSFVRGLLAA
ncbi:MAG: hypothetical protein MUC96_09350 [Myxococcaceae bacterium]|jgi:hypothetical protein|nr:hypothetical protein [Myxococcaceae bacterium]